MPRQAPMQGAQTIHTIVCAFSYLGSRSVSRAAVSKRWDREDVTNKAGLWFIQRGRVVAQNRMRESFQARIWYDMCYVVGLDRYSLTWG